MPHIDLKLQLGESLLSQWKLEVYGCSFNSSWRKHAPSGRKMLYLCSPCERWSNSLQLDSSHTHCLEKSWGPPLLPAYSIDPSVSDLGNGLKGHWPAAALSSQSGVGLQVHSSKNTTWLGDIQSQYLLAPALNMPPRAKPDCSPIHRTAGTGFDHAAWVGSQLTGPRQHLQTYAFQGIPPSGAGVAYICLLLHFPPSPLCTTSCLFPRPGYHPSGKTCEVIPPYFTFPATRGVKPSLLSTTCPDLDCPSLRKAWEAG